MEAKRKKFGKVLRSRRESAGVKMGDLARELDVSVVYVSDVERGSRAPFTTDRITRTAAILGADANELIKVAAEVRGEFTIDPSNLPSERAKEFVASLQRGEQFSTETWDAIASLARKDKER